MSGKDFLYIGVGVALGYLVLPMLLGMLHLTGGKK